MIVEYTRNFDRGFGRLTADLQRASRGVIEDFLDCYASHRFPKSLRVHKCGPFLSLSVTMKYRIFVLPITGGVKFVFIGDHEDAENYLKR